MSPPTPEVLRVGDDTWVHIGDLRKILKHRRNYSERHGHYAVAVAMKYLMEYLDELQEPAGDPPQK